LASPWSASRAGRPTRRSSRLRLTRPTATMREGWRITLKRQQSMLQPLICAPMHPVWSLRQSRGWRHSATQTQAQFACLKMRPSLSAQCLAGVNRVADAAAAEIASQAVVELRHAFFAVRTMEPWPVATEMNPRPRDTNSLGEGVAAQVEEDRVPGRTYLSDAGPSKHWPERDPVAAKESLPSKLANVEAIACQLFDREAGWNR
jgi:hypothetical protein